MFIDSEREERGAREREGERNTDPLSPDWSSLQPGVHALTRSGLSSSALDYAPADLAGWPGPN